ncbi:DUF3823 domain-containing protein [Mucilaginibacter achroorhodeus]|uniref:DUF3823 domain-containing protein n=1 Tax=Mucilaginibacter achroorhodeus TaxID=2599294 RepID=A0A563U094_9SPHI|nr:DUF3823 domain-containing protein [Mucilaginibacter achroorhodeus]TWR24953.1 DUF3823 domain-containing protein [Mucilaginibacter achroorhodeus]
MKYKYSFIILFAIMWAITACKKDTYDAPSVTLKGRLVYNGEPINVEFNQVPFQLYQPGFGKTGAIVGTFGQDGSYSTLLFSGNYKMIIPNGQGPFRWNENQTTSQRDTLAVNVSGDQTLDINVTPYYLINNSQITAANNIVTAKFDISKVITDANARDIERVTLFINKTQFVSGGDNVVQTSIEGSAITGLQNLSITTAIPALTPTQNYVFARVGLKIAGLEDLIFSPLVKVTF